jgi:hypothetical protein
MEIEVGVGCSPLSTYCREYPCVPRRVTLLPAGGEDQTCE